MSKREEIIQKWQLELNRALIDVALSKNRTALHTRYLDRNELSVIKQIIDSSYAQAGVHLPAGYENAHDVFIKVMDLMRISTTPKNGDFNCRNTDRVGELRDRFDKNIAKLEDEISKFYQSIVREEITDYCVARDIERNEFADIPDLFDVICAGEIISEYKRNYSFPMSDRIIYKKSSALDLICYLFEFDKSSMTDDYYKVPLKSAIDEINKNGSREET